tara:strand:- start:328 stop:957 length:630 start_codon:yes stop_codon:yes gene_type:complete
MEFKNAQEAFETLIDELHVADEFRDTNAMFNVGFKILNPLDNIIDTDFRNWNKNYADYEWQWYLSGDPSAIEISKRAPIWKSHMDEEGNVQSNYGWQWNRYSQLDRIIDILHADKHSRQAVLSFYDGKEVSEYAYDTPCTNTVHFQIVNKKLCMTVNMRSNDIWFGFCNDQYCFSKLQELVAKELNVKVGWYYHFASNIHLYKKNRLWN